MKTLKLVVVITVFLFVLAPYVCLADGSVVSTECASLEHGQELAQELATQYALRAASESLGVSVDAQSLITMGILLDDFIHTRTMAYVDHYDVLRHWQEQNQTCVEVKAWVKKGSERTQADKGMLSLHTVAIQGQGLGSEIILKQLSVALAHLGVHVYKVPFGTSRNDIPKLSLADYLLYIESTVEPSQNNHGIQSFYASAEIKCFQVSKDDYIIHESADDLVFGLSQLQALRGKRPDQYTKTIAIPLASRFQQSFSALLSNNTRQLTIHVSRQCSWEEISRLRRKLASMRWVESVGDAKSENDSSQIDVVYSEKAIYLAAMLDIDSMYHVDSFSWDRLHLRMTEDRHK